LLHVDNVSFAYRERRGRRSTARGSSSHGAQTPAVQAFELRGITFELRRGAITGLLGPNGSGKTTLLRIVDGILKPEAGRVLLDGVDLTGFTRRSLARRIAVVPQETHAAFDFTALDIVLMGRFPHLGVLQLEDADDLRVAREAMAATGTAAFESRSFSTLSGGEKQRVVIAGALAQAADLLLLDEPTASLDVGYQIEIATLLASLNRSRGVTMLMSTHDLNLAASLCHELVLMRHGRILDSGPTERVLTADAVRHLYQVDADVRVNARTGHLTVVPIARAH
jgi:iron complex transport system ATP-binding protein